MKKSEKPNIDADACPVTQIAENIAQKYKIPVFLLCDSRSIIKTKLCEKLGRIDAIFPEKGK